MRIGNAFAGKALEATDRPKKRPDNNQDVYGRLLLGLLLEQFHEGTRI